MYQITTDHNPTDNDKKTIREGLIGFNINTIGVQAKSFCIYLKDENNKICGGVLAWMHSKSIYIDVLWLEEKMRSQGYGKKLLLMAEEEAIRQGCHYATLDTYSFQAEAFYLKNGYERLGEIKNYLLEYSKIYLRKEL